MVKKCHISLVTDGKQTYCGDHFVMVKTKAYKNLFLRETDWGEAKALRIKTQNSSRVACMIKHHTCNKGTPMEIHTSKMLIQSKKNFNRRYVKNKTRQTARVIKIRNNSHQQFVPSSQGNHKLRRRMYILLNCWYIGKRKGTTHTSNVSSSIFKHLEP